MGRSRSDVEEWLADAFAYEHRQMGKVVEFRIFGRTARGAWERLDTYNRADDEIMQLEQVESCVECNPYYEDFRIEAWTREKKSAVRRKLWPRGLFHSGVRPTRVGEVRRRDLWKRSAHQQQVEKLNKGRREIAARFRNLNERQREDVLATLPPDSAALLFESLLFDL